MKDFGRDPAGQALAKAEPKEVSALSGFDPSRFLRQLVLVAIFGLPFAAFTLAAILIVLPFLAFMDWLIEGEADWHLAWWVAVGPWKGFISMVQSVSERTGA